MRLLKGCKTTALAINSGLPSLALLAHSFGENGFKKVEAYLKLWLVDINMSLDLKKPLTEHQIDTIAFYIVDKYKNLNIADINIIFNNAKSGEYGETYDRLTIPTVMKWFKKYFDSRLEIAAQQSYQEHQQTKGRMGRESQNFDFLTQVKGAFAKMRTVAHENRDKMNEVKPKKKAKK